MFGTSNQYAIHPEWVSQTAERIREDRETALYISTLITHINRATHIVLQDNGEKNPLNQHTDIEELISRYVQEPSKEGIPTVGMRILHYQSGGFTPFCHIYSERFSKNNTSEISYEKKYAHLVYRELFMIDSQASELYEGLSIPGHYMILNPSLQTSLSQELLQNNINIETLSADHRVIITQDYFTNRTVHIYNKQNGETVSLGFGPRKLH